MRIIILFTGGRSGSDLLQSLLDSHPEVAQFPAILHFTDEFLKIFKLKDPQIIAKKFIELNKFYFDSRLNKKERHYKLGIKKNEFYTVSKKKFVKNFIFLFNKSKKKKLDILICLHKAYMLCQNFNLKKLKIIFLHLHLLENFKNYLKILDVYKNTKILITYRDPLASMCSIVKRWSKYDGGIHMTPRNLYSNYQFHFNIFNNLQIYKQKIRVVKLEKVHTQSKQTLKKISKFIGIRYSNILLRSTYFNKKWWGDSVSKKYLDGLNPKFKNKFDNKIFKNNELKFIESKIIYILKKYDYPIRTQFFNNSKKYFFPFFTIEKIFYINTLKKLKLKTKLSILYFYLKRLILFKEKFLKDNLPNEI